MCRYTYINMCVSMLCCDSPRVWSEACVAVWSAFFLYHRDAVIKQSIVTIPVGHGSITGKKSAPHFPPLSTRVGLPPVRGDGLLKERVPVPASLLHQCFPHRHGRTPGLRCLHGCLDSPLSPIIAWPVLHSPRLRWHTTLRTHRFSSRQATCPAQIRNRRFWATDQRR